MKKIKGRKFSKRLAGAITLALLAAQAGSALAADTYNKQIIENFSSTANIILSS